MKSKTIRILSYVLTALAASALTMVIVFFGTNGGYTKLEQLEDLIESKFIGEADRTAMEDAAAKAMVDALGDRWSYYISAADYSAHEEQMNNAYVGVGITVKEGTGGIEITKVTAGGPGEEAGILAGDLIVAVDGADVRECTVAQVRDLVRGEKNTEVKLTVVRDGTKQTVTVTRREIRTPVATAAMLEGNIGLVAIENFDARCADETIAVIESLLAQGAEGLIFDVRYNPGGYKDELVEVLDYLLPEGPIFRSEYYDGTTEEDTSDAECLDIPMAVLVNGSSYSAAEFFAAALMEYDAAVVVGEQTCGKGYFQNTFRLKDGSAVGLSIGKYYTPKGVSLAGVGVMPDVAVEVDSETASAIYAGTLDPMEDPQILSALAALTD